MKIIIDIEANSLVKPTKIWCIVCKDVSTGDLHVFRGLTDDQVQNKETSLRGEVHYGKEAFLTFAKDVKLWVGHHILGYDLPVLADLLDLHVPVAACLDTLIISKLVDYSRKGGHSIEQYGTEFGLEKIKFNNFKEWSQELEDYCVRDVEICDLVYRKYLHIVSDPLWHPSISLEHRFQLIVNDLHNNGFAFNIASANSLLDKVTKDLGVLDAKILRAFPPREVLIREFTPRATKFGTINKASVPRALHADIHLYEVGKSYLHTKRQLFNPSSHKQLIEVLNEAGWQPEHRTKTHIDTERRLSQAKRGGSEEDRESLRLKLDGLRKTGWQINEHNLGTLPPSAPEGARLLAQRILLESRRRTLTEWIGLATPEGRIHGRFQGIGAWTHRMAHQQPNTANIPTAVQLDGSPKLLGKEMRSLWIAPKNRLLVGVDAEGIQLRIFAHYIQDEEFTDALVKGKKTDGTDSHSLNRRVLGSVCKSREAAKRFVYALLLGGGLGKLASILECSTSDAKQALDSLLRRYEGFAILRKTDIPADAKRGYFSGLDGRHVSIPGETQRDREHFCMSGYLQNGESIVIKRAACIIDDEMAKEEKDLKKWMFCDIVHDEFVMEIRNDMYLANRVKKIAADAIEQAGIDLNLRCPLKGDGNVGLNWYTIH